MVGKPSKTLKIICAAGVTYKQEVGGSIAVPPTSVLGASVASHFLILLYGSKSKMTIS
jgi:hypothetical protein